MRPARLEIAIISVKREVDYIHQTLASLFLSGPELHELPPVRLLVGSPDTHYLDELAHHTGIRIEPLDDAGWRASREWPVARQLALNYWRALSMSTEALEGVCVCEDDVVFRDGFVPKLLAAVEEIRGREPPPFVLTAYSMHEAHPGASRGRYYGVYAPEAHWGNCCVFVSRAALPGAAAHLRRRSVDDLQVPADLALGEYGELLRRRGQGNMFQTMPSLVQHVGYVSTGTSGNYFFSPSFEQPWPA